MKIKGTSMIRLYYKGNGEAKVERPLYLDNSQRTTDTFGSIDEACDFLVRSLNVSDSDMDRAIISMHTNKHSVATFNIEGKFESTKFY